MHYIGKLDTNKIGKYGNKITTYDVVLTEERKNYILEQHKKDYDIIINNIDRTVLSPREILEDIKNDHHYFL